MANNEKMEALNRLTKQESTLYCTIKRNCKSVNDRCQGINKSESRQIQ